MVDVPAPQVKEDEVSQLRKETERLNKTREAIQRKLRNIEDNKSDLEFQRETLKGTILGLERGKLLREITTVILELLIISYSRDQHSHLKVVTDENTGN